MRLSQNLKVETYMGIIARWVTSVTASYSDLPAKLIRLEARDWPNKQLEAWCLDDDATQGAKGFIILIIVNNYKPTIHNLN